MGPIWEEQVIPGLYTVGLDPVEDSRGSFHKILAQVPQEFKPMEIDEIYWSNSQAGVARGMHLQIPPHHGRKLVFATSGTAMDVVIDLRVGSPTFHQVWEKQLTAKSQGVLIPAGCAHGFLVIDSPALLVYAQEGAYDRECDTGVNMQSLQVNQKIKDFKFSDRDQELPKLADFVSPFTFDPTMHVGWGD